MVLALGLFLINSLCAIVPCQHMYEPPVPVVTTDENRDVVTPYSVSGLSFGFMNHLKVAMEKNNFPVAETRTGLVRGFPMLTARSRKIYAFTGIPYAEPPVKELRYRAPKPRRPWKGVWDATTIPPVCLQVSALQHLRIIGVEDCLYLNVYTPQVGGAVTQKLDMIKKVPRPNQNFTKFPVMVFIHGGAFAFSSGAVFGPAYLLDRDVVLVTLNYRLGSMGFLSTGDESAAGNWGLKDQALALSWVSKNIEFFGGNKSKVVIFGQSAGAVSAHLHLMSKMSNGLFHGAIAQSGSAFCFWAVRNASVDYTYKLAARLRCPVNESQVAVDCLREKDPNLIAYHEAMLSDFSVFPGVFFGPVVESPGPEAFLEDWPENLYERKQVAPLPFISGILPGEGNGLALVTYLIPMALEGIDVKWYELGPKVLDIKVDNVKLVSEAVYAIRKFYLQDESINFYSRHQLSEMYGDRLIVAAVQHGLERHASIAPTYGYFFNYTGRYSTTDSYGLNVRDWGLSHDDDLIYLMNSTGYHSLNVGDPEYEMSEFLINLWTNFAEKGQPVYTTDDGEDFNFWNFIKSPSRVELALLDGEYPVMIPNPYMERIKLWKALNLVTGSHVNSQFRSLDICSHPKLMCARKKPPTLPTPSQLRASQKTKKYGRKFFKSMHKNRLSRPVPNSLTRRSS